MPSSTAAPVDGESEPQSTSTPLEERNQMYARLGYLFVYFALAACVPYYSRLLSSHGMSSKWIGVLMAVQPLSILFLLPPLSHLADRLHCAGRILSICGVISCIALVAVTAFPMPLALLSLFMACHFCSICTFSAFFDQRVLSTLTAAQKAEWGATRCFGSIGWGVMAPVSSIMVGITGWWIVGALYTGFYVASMWCYVRLSPCPETIDAMAREGESEAGAHHDGSTPPPKREAAAAAAVDIFPGDMLPMTAIDGDMDYSASHAAAKAAHAEDAGPRASSEPHADVQPAVVPVVAPEASFMHILKLICTRRRVLFVLLFQCIGGAGYTIITTYLFLFLDTLQSPSWLYGVAVTMTVVVEIPLFRISDLLHERLSDRKMLVLALLGWSARVLGYSILPASAPWSILVLEPLHGVSFGFLWLSGVHFITRAFPPSFSASSIGFLNAATFGVGPVVGNIVGGWLYDGIGPRALFACSGLVMLVLAASYAVCDAAWEKKGYSMVVSEDGSAEHLVVE